MELVSTIQCPQCRVTKKETMPTNACQVFYQCASCKTMLRPREGDCCVFCSYGDVKCPPKQSETCCAEENNSGKPIML